MRFFKVNLRKGSSLPTHLSQVSTLCGLINHAPQSAIDLLDMLTVDPKARALQTKTTEAWAEHCAMTKIPLPDTRVQINMKAQKGTPERSFLYSSWLFGFHVILQGRNHSTSFRVSEEWLENRLQQQQRRIIRPTFECVMKNDDKRFIVPGAFWTKTRRCLLVP